MIETAVIAKPIEYFRYFRNSREEKARSGMIKPSDVKSGYTPI
jgi:hypothetical protein